MEKKKKYYVVWKGRNPGIYTSWKECEREVKEVAAQYKSFENEEEAREAFRNGYEAYRRLHPIGSGGKKKAALSTDANGIAVIENSIANPPTLDALAVDAACSGNPGVMEYQGVYVATRTRVFHYRAEKGTNNIGEFLAIVHGLSYLKKHHLNQILYSDSVNAINWVRQKQCKSKLPLTPDTADLWDYIHRAENWLKQNSYTTEIRKWDTDSWGEIPADFGRK